MFNKVNYMKEIETVNKAIDQIDESETKGSNVSIRSRLSAMLYNLETAAEDMASYISGQWDYNAIDYLKQSNVAYMASNDYQNYLSGLTKLLRLERIMLICSTQTPDEKSYFMIEYTKYKEDAQTRDKVNSKVR